MYNKFEQDAFEGYMSREDVGNIILFGQEGLGKKRLLIETIKARFCMNAKGYQRGCSCDSCKRVDVDNHPDLLLVTSDGKSIGKNVIVKLQEDLDCKTVLAKERFIVIDDAECLTEEAQNSMLKCVEDAPIQNKFVFISTRPLLGTIHSRSTRFDFQGVTLNAFSSFFDMDQFHIEMLYVLSSGAIGKAKRIADSDYFTKLSAACEMLIDNFHSYSALDVLKLFDLVSETSRKRKVYMETCGEDLSAVAMVISQLLSDKVITSLPNSKIVFESKRESIKNFVLSDRYCVSKATQIEENVMNRRFYSFNSFLVLLVQIMSSKEEKQHVI